MRLYINLWVVVSGLVGWLGIWKKYDWKIGDKEIWGRGMWMDFFEWLKIGKIFVFYVNVY